MPRQITLALVVAEPGHLWSGLHSLLRTVPQIEIIAEANDAAVLLNMGAEIHPEIVLLDASLFDENTWPGITKIKGEWPHTHCVALVEDDLQRQRAQDAGADFVLSKGFPAARLVTLIEDLLSQRENDSRIEPDMKEQTLANSEGGDGSDDVGEQTVKVGSDAFVEKEAPTENLIAAIPENRTPNCSNSN
jgi:DNA-binding NarL/FixJ family response regulator